MPPLAWGLAVQDHAHAAFVAGGRVGLGASRQAAPPAHTCGSARIRRVAATMAAATGRTEIGGIGDGVLSRVSLTVQVPQQFGFVRLDLLAQCWC